LIQILDKSFEVFITSEEIQKEVKSLGETITKDYNDKEIVFVAVLNGAFMFTSDLMKTIECNCEISFVKMSSYHGTQSKGTVDELIGLNIDLKDKHVIVIEDIVDTGITINKIVSMIDSHQPASTRICTLLFKPDAFQGKNQPDYVGFSIPDAFVVGYGLDYDEKGRNLDAIYQIRN